MTEEIYAADEGIEQEVSEPVTEDIEEVNDVEEPETTEQASEELPEGKSKQDSAFAQMRREKEEAIARAKEFEQRIAEMEAKQSARQNAFSSITGGGDDAVLQALADQYGVSVEDVEEAIEEAEAEQAAEAEQQRIIQERDYYKNLYVESEIAAMSKADIEAINKAFPDHPVKDFEELNTAIGAYKKANPDIPAEQAYQMYLNYKEMTEPKPPKEIGQIGKQPDDSGFLSREQVDAMTDEEQEANYELILKSQRRWT